MFQLNESYRYILGRSEIYLYHQLSTNPLWLSSLIDIQNHLSKEHRKNLDMQDLAIYVDKIRKVEEGKRFVDAFISTADSQEDAARIKAKLAESYEDGSLQYAIEKIAENKKPHNLPFSVETSDWLNSYYGEDVVSRLNLMLTILIQEKHRLTVSRQVAPELIGRTARKPSIALVVINNRVIEVDSSAKVKQNEDTGDQELITKNFGTFKIREARTRYKYGKQAIYFVMVKTKKPKVVPPVIEPSNGKGAKPVLPPKFVEDPSLPGYFYDPDNPRIIYEAAVLAKELEQKRQQIAAHQVAAPQVDPQKSKAGRKPKVVIPPTDDIVPVPVDPEHVIRAGQQ